MVLETGAPTHERSKCLMSSVHTHRPRHVHLADGKRGYNNRAIVAKAPPRPSVVRTTRSGDTQNQSGNERINSNPPAIPASDRPTRQTSDKRHTLPQCGPRYDVGRAGISARSRNPVSHAKKKSPTFRARRRRRGARGSATRVGVGPGPNSEGLQRVPGERIGSGWSGLGA